MPTPRRAAARSASPRCPRCGYDLSGAARALGLAWPASADASPGGGAPGSQPRADGPAAAVTCSECGLSTAWIDVLDPARRDVPWLFEHALRGHIGLRRAWRTLLRSLFPWLFWRTVTLSTRLSVARLLLYLPVLIVPLHVAGGLANFMRRWQFVGSVGSGRPLGPSWKGYFLAGAFSQPLFQFGPDGAGGWIVIPPDVSYTIAAPLAAGLLMPVLLLVLGRTRATARVRPAHILRAGVYGLAWLPCWYLLWTLVTVSRAVLERVYSRPMGWGPGLRFFGLRLGEAAPFAVGLCMLWFGAWWWCVVKLGLRLPRAGLVWVVLMTACLLLAVVAATHDQDFANWLGGMLN